MSEDFEEYARYFMTGVRVRVGIPLAAGGVFQEWGVVGGLDRDLLELQLSRDLLPKEARLDIGREIALRVVRQKRVHFCRGIVVGEEPLKHYSVRLIEDVVLDEPREYFRHEVFLPVEYRVPVHQDPEKIKKRWQEKRLDLEFAGQQPAPGEPESVTAEREKLQREMPAKTSHPPRAANISGGGVRFVMPQSLAPQTLVVLTLYLPEPRKALEIIGEVVSRQPLQDGVHFSTALHFRYIDERDRDAIIAFVTAQEQAYLARLRGTRLGEHQVGAFFGKKGYWLRVAMGLAVIALCTGYLAHSIVARHDRGEKHEIERIFEDGVKKYLRPQG